MECLCFCPGGLCISGFESCPWASANQRPPIGSAPTCLWRCVSFALGGSAVRASLAILGDPARAAFYIPRVNQTKDETDFNAIVLQSVNTKGFDQASVSWATSRATSRQQGDLAPNSPTGSP